MRFIPHPGVQVTEQQVKALIARNSSLLANLREARGCQEEQKRILAKIQAIEKSWTS
jgi:bacterioferritin-associated ferredoxin